MKILLSSMVMTVLLFCLAIWLMVFSPYVWSDIKKVYSNLRKRLKLWYADILETVREIRGLNKYTNNYFKTGEK